MLLNMLRGKFSLTYKHHAVNRAMLVVSRRSYSSLILPEPSLTSPRMLIEFSQKYFIAWTTIPMDSSVRTSWRSWLSSQRVCRCPRRHSFGWCLPSAPRTIANQKLYLWKGFSKDSSTFWSRRLQMRAVCWRNCPSWAMTINWWPPKFGRHLWSFTRGVPLSLCRPATSTQSCTRMLSNSSFERTVGFKFLWIIELFGFLYWYVYGHLLPIIVLYFMNRWYDYIQVAESEGL